MCIFASCPVIAAVVKRSTAHILFFVNSIPFNTHDNDGNGDNDTNACGLRYILIVLHFHTMMTNLLGRILVV